MIIRTRKGASEEGLNKYYTGEPCKNGHVTERYTQSGACAGCLAAHRETVAATLRGGAVAQTLTALGDTRRAALATLQPLKVRAYAQDWAYMKQFSFAVLTMRYPGVLKEWDAFDRKPGKDGKGGTLLYIVHAHPDDHANIKAEEGRLLRQRAPDVEQLRAQAFGRLAEMIAGETEAPPEFKP